MERYANVSTCGKYRYSLTRIWDYSKPFVMFIGINPNRADANDDDQTTRRLKFFAEENGYGGYMLTNLFGYRSPDPLELATVEDPIGPENDESLLTLHKLCKDVIFMWGNEGVLFERDKKIIEMFPNALCFGRSKKNGNPKHPLYLKNTTKLVRYAEEVI